MLSNMVQRLALCAVVLVGAPGCVGMVVGAAADTAIEVGKVPFKVGGAVVEAVRDDKKEADEEKDKQDDE